MLQIVIVCYCHWTNEPAGWMLMFLLITVEVFYEVVGMSSSLCLSCYVRNIVARVGGGGGGGGGGEGM